MKRRVAIGHLGTVMDMKRRDGMPRWRPTIALCRQDDLFMDRLELICDQSYSRLAHSVMQDIETLSPATQVRLHKVSLTDPWDFAEMYNTMRDFALDYAFDTEREDYFIHMTTGTHVAQICWFLLTEAGYIPGRLIQTAPPRKQDQKDPEKLLAGTYSVIDLDLSRYDAIATRFSTERRDATAFLKSGIATRNSAFNTMIDEIEQVAIRSRAPVLLTGPTGAGKSHLAKRIFKLKQQQKQVKGAFVEVNCATLRGDQAMSTLFGHKRGAFTGAQTERPGLLKAADNGVLFLDEIGELGLDEQAMCLKAIEEKRFLPLGADKDTSADFQLIAGTNQDLADRVRKGHFRDDLFARLNMWTFALPALCDRREDIEPNLDYELARLIESEGRHITFNKEARNAYRAFALSEEASWKANFRDLSASVTRMGTLAPRGRIDLPTVKQEIQRLLSAWGGTHEIDGSGLLEQHVSPEHLQSLDPFDAAQLEAVLKICLKSPNLSAAGRTLFARSRLTKKSGNDADRLRKYLARFDLSFRDLRP